MRSILKNINHNINIWKCFYSATLDIENAEQQAALHFTLSSLSVNHFYENTENILLIFFQLDIASQFWCQLGFFLPGKLFNMSTFCQEGSGMLLQILNSFENSPHMHRSEFSWKVSSSAVETLVWYWLRETHAASWVTITALWDSWICSGWGISKYWPSPGFIRFRGLIGSQPRAVNPQARFVSFLLNNVLGWGGGKTRLSCNE